VADVEVSGVRALRRAGVAGCYVFIVPPTLETMRANLTRMFEKREDGEAKAAEMFCFGESEIAALREPVRGQGLAWKGWKVERWSGYWPKIAGCKRRGALPATAARSLTPPLTGPL